MCYKDKLREIKYISLYLLRLLKLNTVQYNKVNIISDFFSKSFSKLFVKEPVSTIILDPFTVPEWVISNSYFVNVLASETQAEIKTFGIHKGSKSPLEKVIFKSFNVSGHIQTVVKDVRLLKKKKGIISKAIEEITSKQKLYDLTVNDVWIGVDIYETYLRFAPAPTIDFKDNYFWDVLNEGVELLLFWEDYFENNHISGVVISHDCYNSMDILAKVAYKFDVPVYMPNPLGIQKIDRPFALFKDRFKSYKRYFGSLSESEKIKAIKLSKSRLDLRLSGEVGVDILYSTKSAFKSENFDTPIMKKSDKIKVVIATHDLYDNPHGYGGMLFLDFYEWLEFLVEVSNESDYDWYIKTHPDFSQKTVDVIKKLVLDQSNIKLIPPETSFHQLSNEGLDFVLTCWGSVGHELPLLGIQVINASKNNPHIAYDFNWQPTSIKEYKELLFDLPRLNKKIKFEEIYEFYYINYFYTEVDDLIFNSYSKMRSDLSGNKQFSLDVYLYFIEQINSNKSNQIIENMRRFITSNKSNYFIQGPED